MYEIPHDTIPYTPMRGVNAIKTLKLEVKSTQASRTGLLAVERTLHGIKPFMYRNVEMKHISQPYIDAIVNIVYAPECIEHIVHLETFSSNISFSLPQHRFDYNNDLNEDIGTLVSLSHHVPEKELVAAFGALMFVYARSSSSFERLELLKREQLIVDWRTKQTFPATIVHEDSILIMTQNIHKWTHLFQEVFTALARSKWKIVHNIGELGPKTVLITNKNVTTSNYFPAVILDRKATPPIYGRMIVTTDSYNLPTLQYESENDLHRHIGMHCSNYIYTPFFIPKEATINVKRIRYHSNHFVDGIPVSCIDDIREKVFMNNGECCICLNEYTDKVYLLSPCKHVLCKNCYRKLRQDACPCCRTNVEITNLIPVKTNPAPESIETWADSYKFGTLFQSVDTLKGLCSDVVIISKRLKDRAAYRNLDAYIDAGCPGSSCFLIEGGEEMLQLKDYIFHLGITKIDVFYFEKY
jgi:hypothetical protein